MSNRRNRLGLALVAGLIITGVAGTGSLPASGDSVAPEPATIPYGTLTLQLTDQAGTLAFRRATDNESFVQELGVSTPCSTLTSGDIVNSGESIEEQELLSLIPTGGSNSNVQLPKDGIGVTDGANCGGPAGLIGPGETLTLQLGDFFDEDVMIGTGQLNIGKPHPQGRDLVLAYDGDDAGEPIDIANGGQIVEIGANFKSVTLASTAISNSRGLSLKTNTVFNLVVLSDYESVLECDEDEEFLGATGDAATSATLVNQPEGTNDCRVDFTLEILEDGVFLAKDDIPGANLTLEIVWAPGKKVFEINLAGPPAQGDLNDGDYEQVYAEWLDGEDFKPVVWCDSFDADNLTAVHPADTPWCLVSDMLVDDQRIQVYHGQGDPYWKAR